MTSMYATKYLIQVEWLLMIDELYFLTQLWCCVRYKGVNKGSKDVVYAKGCLHACIGRGTKGKGLINGRCRQAIACNLPRKWHLIQQVCHAVLCALTCFCPLMNVFMGWKSWGFYSGKTVIIYLYWTQAGKFSNSIFFWRKYFCSGICLACDKLMPTT